jgi:predicted secreted hydrolase
VKRLSLLVAVVVAVSACGGAPLLANAPLVERPTPTRGPTPAPFDDPQPVQLPRDDGPHDRLTEWWYYTGHLVAADGRRFGFEAVVFRAERGDAPVTWAAHLALTDEAGKRFLVAQRTALGPAPDRSPRAADGAPAGFDLRLTGAPLPNGEYMPDTTTWQLSGSAGHDTIEATLMSSEALVAGGGFGLDLRLTAEKPSVLHDRDGWIDFGPAGSSYYYSRTRMDVAGTLSLDGSQLAVAGLAWFDHQWGDFISVGGGGWDWFAVDLDDRTELTLSVVRAADGSLPLVYGTYVDAAGQATHLDRDAFTIRQAGSWTSDRTGATYPSGWHVTVPSLGLEIDLTPTLADQELDTRPTTGVVYWEGSQRVAATRDGVALGGEAYVELTGYPTTGEAVATP